MSDVKKNISYIYIIGNVHDSTLNYNSETLFKILDNIKPDIILHEVDSLIMENYKNGINSSGNEIEASNLFIKKYPNTIRLPYDFERKKEYKRRTGIIPVDDLTTDLIESLNSKGLLSRIDKKNYNKYIKLTNELFEISKMKPKKFNNKKTDFIVKKRQKYQYKKLLNIVKNRDEFKEKFVIKPNNEKISYREGYILACKFWDIRNRIMAKNIINIIESNPSKKIVVLTGFMHRYYLIDLLKNKYSLEYINFSY